MQKLENFAEQVADGTRFEFGKNWARFLARLDDERIGEAIKGVRTVLRMEDLKGLRLLDIGCGSGLSSLAARRLGARVVSFDFDPFSVACTRELKLREKSNDDDWRVLEGSVLEAAFMESLGEFDIVYSWGVLHHTGSMWTAIENAIRRVKPGGRLCVAIYNDQGKWSRAWLWIKRAYNRLPRALRWLVTVPMLIRLWGPTMIWDLLRGKPMHAWNTYATNRGMSPWHDLVDWVGGLPFEVAAPDVIFRFFDERGFRLIFLKTCAGGIGCNEYTVVRN
jgi:2-polyprenyl-6-hydroxyphenyl methylase/3-demethylubiquinone-9 3-methyltransferase